MCYNVAMDVKATLEFDKITEKLANYAKTAQSKELCRNLRVFDDANIIAGELNLTREAKAILDSPAELPISHLVDFSEIKYSTMHGYLGEEEIYESAKTLTTFRHIKKFLSDYAEYAPKLAEIAKNITPDKDLEDKIYSAFDESLQIKHNATPVLAGLYSSLSDNEKNLKKTVTGLLNNPDFSKHLQENIYTTRDDRIVFQVMAPSKNKINGIVHDVSASGRTFYVEPEQVVPLNNRIREIKSQIHAEIVRILVGFTNLIKSNIEEFIKSEKICAEIDFHFAKARYAVKIKAVEPLLAVDKIIKLEEMRHPLLIDVVEQVVANDFEIGNDCHSIVITGSNTGGKTVTIKTVGLFILMTKAGMFLPCASARIYPFKNIFADIGDAQSIQQSLSTFSSHMKNIIEILNKADDKTFVIFDEICAGTDPTEGALLAKTILEYLAEKKVTSIVTTHYGELKSLEYTNSYFKNASVEFDISTLKPTYKLLIGIPGLSNAILVASNLGLPPEISDKAKDLLHNQKDSSIIVVEKLQETQHKLTQELNTAQELKVSADEIKKEYEENLTSLKKDKKKTVKIIKDKFEREIMDIKAEIKEIMDELRREKSEKLVRRAYARLANIEGGFKDKLSEHEIKEEYGEVDWNTIKVGTKLTVKELNQIVELLSLPDKNGKVQVKMGNLVTKLPIKKLAPYNKNFDNSGKYKAPNTTQNFTLKKYSVSARLDLRGYRVEDALDSLELYLDEVSLASLQEVIVIHGHGTGALKQAVREYLADSPYVASFRPGNDSEGGDGVCVVKVK